MKAEPKNYRVPGMCACCTYGDWRNSNPYQFECLKYPEFPINECGVCEDFEDRQMPEKKCGNQIVGSCD